MEAGQLVFQPVKVKYFIPIIPFFMNTPFFQYSRYF